MASVRKRSWTTPKGEPRAAWFVDFVDASGNRGRKLFRTRRAADAFRIEAENQIQSGTFRPDARRITVKQLVDLYLDHCQGRMERGERMTRHNLACYRGHLANHVLHPIHGIGAKTLALLTTRAVNDFRDRLRAS